MFSKLLHALSVIALAALPWRLAAQVLVIQGEEQPSYQEAFAGIRSAVPAARLLPLATSKDAVKAGDVVILIGDAAAGAELPPGTPVLAALLSDPELARLKRWTNINVLADAFAFMSKVQDLVPGLTELAVFRVKDHYQDHVKYLGAAAAVSTIKVRASGINNPGDLASALRSLPGRAQALWLAPDPLLMQTDNFKLIARFCQASKIALIAPLPLLARAGALAAVAPSYKDIGAAAGKAAASLLAGKGLSPEISSNQCEVLINGATARALGIRVDAKQGQILEP